MVAPRHTEWIELHRAEPLERSSHAVQAGWQGAGWSQQVTFDEEATRRRG